jgi:hypothetical protein
VFPAEFALGAEKRTFFVESRLGRLTNALSRANLLTGEREPPMYRPGIVLFSATVLLVGHRASAATFVTLPPIPAAQNETTTFNGIDGNNIVGSYVDASYAAHGFLYNGAAYKQLDYPTADSTFAVGISGQNIIGVWEEGGITPDSLNFHGFLFDGSSYHTIDDPLNAGYSFLTGISGTNIVGYYNDAGGVSHSFLYNGSAFIPIDHPGAGNGPSEGTRVNGISGNRIVGIYRDAAENDHSFLFDGANYSDLSYPGFNAEGIDGNNIVGWFLNPTSGVSSLLYDGSTWTELDFPIPDPGQDYTETYASGISGNIIVGHYNVSEQHYGGFVVIIPEPPSVILLAIGGLSLAAAAKAIARRAKPVN